MKLFFFLLSLSSHAATWDLCLDKANFNLSAEGFLTSVKMQKQGCKLSLFRSGDKKEKYELDLCDSDIHINAFATNESLLAERVNAGSAHCPHPFFGMDFGKEQKNNTFPTTKARVLEILKEVVKVYADKVEKIDLSKLNEQNIKKSELQVACTKSLMEEYLNQCTAFEEPRTPQKL